MVGDLRYACRTLFRAPLAAATIVVTVGLGLGLVAAVYTILNAMVFRVDEVRNPHELFSIERRRAAVPAPETFTRAQYETLLRETKVFADAFATTGDVHVLVDGVRREGRAVTGNFFGVLGAGAAQGRVLTPADDEPGHPPVIVLSHRAWTQHFDADPGVVGRTYRVNGTLFQVIGVTPEAFRGLEVIAAPDFWAPLSTYDVLRERGVREGAGEETDALGVGLDVVGRLAPGVSREQAEAELVAWDTQRTLGEERSGQHAVESLVLTPNTGTMPQPAQAMLAFTPLFFAFGLILMIGCANVANLLLARLVARQRELGVRLAMGASRRRVVWQLLIENLLLSLLAAALAFGLARVALRSFVYFIVTSFPPDIGSLRLAVPSADWRVAVFLVLAAVASTVLFALGPALRATRSDVTRSINGQLLAGARLGRARNGLVTLQVTASVLLLICAAIFLRGTLAASTRDPGVRTADVVNVTVLDEQKRGAILEAVRNDPSVASVAAAWPGFFGGLGGLGAYGETTSGKSVIRYALVSPEFFGVLGIDVVRGRGFAPAERSMNESVAVVSETVARELWPGGDALGQTLRLEPDPSLGRPASAPPLPPKRTDDPMLRPRTAVVVGVDARRGRLFGRRHEARRRRRLPAGEHRSGEHGAAHACPRRRRARALWARRPARRDRPEHRRGIDARDAREHRRLHPRHFVLAHARARIARVAVDVIGPVQRALVPRGATQARDRRAHGARRDQPQRRRARVTADRPAGRPRSSDRRLPHGRVERRTARDAGRSAHRVDRAAIRSRRLRGQRDLYRRGVRGRGAVPALCAGRVNPLAALRQD